MKKTLIIILMFSLIIEIGFIGATIIIPNYEYSIESTSNEELNNNKIINDEENTETSNEIISKRTYNSRTFNNLDGSYTAKISSGRIFFYDGNQYIEMEKLSNPMIEKKDIALEKIPNTNIFDFGVYTLHEGITASIENYELVLKDSNNEIIKKLARPFSTDAKGNVLENAYIINQKENTLKIFVEVDEQWLENANYPIIVDPTFTLTGTAVTYDGYLEKIGPSPLIRIDSSDIIRISDSGGPFPTIRRGFMEFDTSIIPDNVESIDNVVLRIYVHNPCPSALCLITITSFEGNKINLIVNYPDDSTGNTALWNDILNGFGTPTKYIIGSTHFQTIGTKNIDLTNAADFDLKSQLVGNFFGMGFLSPSDAGPEFRSSEYSTSFLRPQLIVTYTLSLCTPPLVGDWVIDGIQCTFSIVGGVTDGQLRLINNGELIIDGTGDLTVQGVSSPTRIRISPGSKIRILPGGSIQLIPA